MTQENLDQIKNELEQAKNTIKYINAEKDAAKQMYNDYANSLIQMRTQYIIVQQVAGEYKDQIDALNKEIESYKSQIVNLTNKILELNPPKENEVITPILKEKKS